MANISIDKFFKYGYKAFSTVTPEGIDSALQTVRTTNPSGEGIGFVVNTSTTVPEILGITAKGAQVNFAKLGGGVLGAAVSNNVATVTLDTPTTDSTFGIDTVQSSYITITSSGTNMVTLGTTQATYSSTGWGANGLVNNTTLVSYVTDYVKDGKLQVSGNGFLDPEDLFTANQSGTSTISLGTGLIGTLSSGTLSINHSNSVTAASNVGSSTAYSSSDATSGTFVPVVSYDAQGHITASSTSEVTASNIKATYNGTSTTVTNQSVQSVLDSLDTRLDNIETASAVTFGSSTANNNQVTITVSQNSIPVANQVVLTAVIDSNTGYGLGLADNTGNAPTLQLSANTLTALGHADSAIQGVQIEGVDLTKDANNKVEIPLAADNLDHTTSTTGLIKGLRAYDGSITSGVITLNTNTATSSTNPIATMTDLNNVATRAMHYKGTTAAVPTGTPETGDMYIASGPFTVAGKDVQTGDYIVYNGSSWDVVQGNVTIGTNNGEIAPNDGNLTAGQLVVATNDGISTVSATSMFDTTGTDAHFTVDETGANPVIDVKSNTLTLNGTTIHDNDGNTYSDPFAWENIQLP